MGKKNPVYMDVEPVSSLAEMIERKAKDMPEGVAFRFTKGRDQIENKTYADTYMDVRKAASRIEERFGTGQHIAVLGENSYEWLVAFFAVMTSGNVAVPIDKELPAAEVAALIAAADAKAIFISKTYSDLAEGIDGLQLTTL